MKIKTKILLSLLLVVFFGVSTVFLVSFFVSRNILTHSIAGYNTFLARSSLSIIDSFIFGRIERWQAYIESNPDLIDAIEVSNRNFYSLPNRDSFIAERERAWQDTVDSSALSFVKEILTNELANKLKIRADFYEEKYGYDIFPEIFVTNQYGVVIASTNKTSDYMQADEDWWTRAQADDIFLEDISIDESTGKKAIAISLAIHNRNVDNKFIGVIKIIYDISDIFNAVDNIVNKTSSEDEKNFGVSRQTVSATLVNRDGNFIYSTDSANKGISNLNEAELKSILYKPIHNYLIIDDNGKEELYSHAHSEGYLDFKGLGWVLVVEKETEEALSPLNSLISLIAVSSLLIFLIAFVLVIRLSNYLSRPINELIIDVKKVGEGDYGAELNIKNSDELGELADSFNKMVHAVKKSREAVDIKVAEQTKEIEAKSVALAEKQKALLNVLEDVEVEKNKLALAKAQDEAVLAGIGDGVFVLDSDRKIVLFNPTSEKISGFSAGEAIGRRYDKVLRFLFEKTGKVNDDFIRESLTLGRVVQMANHTVLIRKDGTKVQVADSAAPIRDKQGKITGCVVVFRDVTKEREIDQMKSEFVSVASHQLRTPLTGIKWFSELMAKTKISQKTKEYLHEIIVSTERMVRLVDDLLNVSRIDTGRKFDIILKQIDIIQILQSVIQEQMPGAAIKKLKLTLAANVPKSMVLSIDELKMRQVFQNLVNNAIKYSKEKTAIEVGCDKSKKDEVVFYVRDHGVGIPKKQQVQVFNKFFRAENVITMHTDGTGLGLYIARAIVEAHHGRIWFESEENKGTTFFFSLPTKLVAETKVPEKKELIEEKPPVKKEVRKKKTPAEKNLAVDKVIAKNKVINKFSKKK